jgi:hypothetical protein
VIRSATEKQGFLTGRDCPPPACPLQGPPSPDFRTKRTTLISELLYSHGRPPTLQQATFSMLAAPTNTP